MFGQRFGAFAATAFVALACCFAVAMVVVAPMSAARGGLLAPLMYEIFAPVCHQIAERSFHLAGHPLAVCHRCFGFYVGFTLGLIVLPLLRPARDWLLEKPRRVLLFLAPTVIDWLLPMNTPASRFLTGVLAAAPIAVLVWAAVGQLAQRVPRNLPAGNP
jgi:uncharacterized membrane protein